MTAYLHGSNMPGHYLRKSLVGGEPAPMRLSAKHKPSRRWSTGDPKKPKHDPKPGAVVTWTPIDRALGLVARLVRTHSALVRVQLACVLKKKEKRRESWCKDAFNGTLCWGLSQSGLRVCRYTVCNDLSLGPAQRQPLGTNRRTVRYTNAPHGEPGSS